MKELWCYHGPLTSLMVSVGNPGSISHPSFISCAFQSRSEVGICYEILKNRISTLNSLKGCHLPATHCHCGFQVPLQCSHPSPIPNVRDSEELSKFQILVVEVSLCERCMLSFLRSYLTSPLPNVYQPSEDPPIRNPPDSGKAHQSLHRSCLPPARADLVALQYQSAAHVVCPILVSSLQAEHRMTPSRPSRAISPSQRGSFCH